MIGILITSHPGHCGFGLNECLKSVDGIGLATVFGFDDDSYDCNIPIPTGVKLMAHRKGAGGSSERLENSPGGASTDNRRIEDSQKMGCQIRIQVMRGHAFEDSRFMGFYRPIGT